MAKGRMTRANAFAALEVRILRYVNVPLDPPQLLLRCPRKSLHVHAVMLPGDQPYDCVGGVRNEACRMA